MPDRERRKSRRHQLKESAYVILRSHPPIMGQLVDITPDTVAFRCLVDGPEEIAGQQQVDIMLNGGEIYIRGLPVTGVAERREESQPYAHTVTRIVAVEFGELTAEQRQQLDELLALRKTR